MEILEILWNLPSGVKITIGLLIIGIFVSFFKKMIKLAILLSVCAVLIIVVIKLLNTM
jgi:hypothetical protein